jgi:hypothetical protein
MVMEIPRAPIEYIGFGSGDSRHQPQDSPTLGDVWIEYAEHPVWFAGVHADVSARTTSPRRCDGHHKENP